MARCGAHISRRYGEGMLDALGLDDEQFVAFVRSQVEPLFSLPFGQVDLRTMLIGDGATDGKRAGQRTRRSSRCATGGASASASRR